MQRIGIEEKKAVERVIDSKNLFKINKGLREAENFESELAEKFRIKNALLMTSGHAALESALIALGIGPGDEVIVPAYTYIATAMAVVGAGAIPVIAEIDETLTIDPSDIEKKISAHTKAILPVHIQGFPCNMDAICKIAKEHSLFVIEDACQADGGSYKGKRLGCIGDAGALSFNQFKIISAGEGGALLTDNIDIYRRALIYHDSSAVAFFGNQLEENNEPMFCGEEYRTNEITATIMREQLKKLDPILSDLRKNKKRIADAVSDVCTFSPSNDENGDCATTLSILFDTKEKAEAFAASDGVHGSVPINTGKHIYKNWTAIMEKRGAYNPLMDPFKMEANKDIVPDYREDMCPKTLDILSRTVYINISADMDDNRIDSVISAVRAALKK